MHTNDAQQTNMCIPGLELFYTSDDGKKRLLELPEAKLPHHAGAMSLYNKNKMK